VRKYQPHSQGKKGEKGFNEEFLEKEKKREVRG